MAALALATVPGAVAGGGAAKTTGTKGAVDSISADGNRVAIHAEVSGNPSCHSGGIWQPTTGKVVHLKDAACGSQSASDAEYDALTLAGTRLAWTDYDYGNHAYCYGPFTATLAKPKPVDIGDTRSGWG